MASPQKKVAPPELNKGMPDLGIRQGINQEKAALCCEWKRRDG
jgi:hypothetical protein